MEPREFKSRVGFTIVEMLLVTVLIAMLAGVTGGFYVKTHKRALVRKSARDFLLAVQYAKIMAIEWQSECELEIDAVNNGFVLIINEFDEERAEANQLIVKDLYFKPIKFAENIKFEEIRIKPTDLSEDQGNVITFRPDGTAQEAVVQIGDGDNYYTVCVSAVNGKANIYEEKAKDVKGDTIDLDQE